MFATTLVAQSGDRTVAIVGIDLVKIRRDLADAAIAEASRQTGINRDTVMICPESQPQLAVHPDGRAGQCGLPGDPTRTHRR